MQTELISHVRGLVRLVDLLLLHLHRHADDVGEVVSCLSHLALQDLHEAMSVAVVVDRTLLARRPHKDKLFKESVGQRLHLSTATLNATCSGG